MGTGVDADAPGHRKDEPRKVVGSVDTSEFLVAVAASIGFLIGLGVRASNPPSCYPCSPAE